MTEDKRLTKLALPVKLKTHKESYYTAHFLYDAEGRMICRIEGNQLDPKGISIGAAEDWATLIRDLLNGALEAARCDE